MCVDAQHGLDRLREAVPSVLGQTHEDLVLRIFLDGPVSDDVRRHLEGLIDSRVSIERAETHQGRAVGLNRLIDESLRAGSDLIARMSADGACHPERLAKQLAFLARHPEVAVLGAGCVELDERTGKESLEIPPADDWTLKRGLIRRPPFVPSTVVFRADVFRRRNSLPDSRVGRHAPLGGPNALWLALRQPPGTPSPVPSLRIGSSDRDPARARRSPSSGPGSAE